MSLFTNSLFVLLLTLGPLQVHASSAWFHEPDHPVHQLFRREQGDATAYPPVGSPAWSSGFPKTTSDLMVLPEAWKDALDAAVRAGEIPDIPWSNNTPGTNPIYPPNVNPLSDDVCSATYKCRHRDDVWDAPDGVFACGFDDGPQPNTPTLVNFLGLNNVTATHFVIGTNILYYPGEFIQLLEMGHDVAVHTWTHPYMTTLSNEHILAELGWTMRIIHDSTGGRLPKFWRPPFGDADNRVRAIAYKIFGLTTIMWNQDTRDWSLITGGTTPTIVQDSMQKWLSGPKKPGLIILEHESSNKSVDAFMNIFPSIKSNGWNMVSVAQLGNGSAYCDPSSSDSSSVIGLMNGHESLTAIADAAIQSPTTSQSTNSGPTALLHKQLPSPIPSQYGAPGQLALNSSARKPDISRTSIGGIIVALSFIAQHIINY